MKTVFVLLALVLGGTGHKWTMIDKFDSQQECQAVAEEIKAKNKGTKTLCYEKHEKKFKMNCKIKNNYSHRHPSGATTGVNSSMNSYPYPESFSCVEE